MTSANQSPPVSPDTAEAVHKTNVGQPKMSSPREGGLVDVVEVGDSAPQDNPTSADVKAMNKTREHKPEKSTFKII